MKSDTFTIIGKGNKERVGYINKAAKEVLLEYLELRKKLKTKNSKDNDALFLSNKRNRISISAIRRMIKKAYKAVGIDENEYSVHTLRHTCATILYKVGTDIKIIKEILGHVQIDTTEIYTHLHNKEVMKAMQEHPLSKFKMADAYCFCAT